MMLEAKSERAVAELGVTSWFFVCTDASGTCRLEICLRRIGTFQCSGKAAMPLDQPGSGV